MILACGKVTRTSHNNRHDSIVHIIAKWVKRVGGYIEIEPRLVFPNTEKRVDAIIYLGMDTYHIDVAIVQPSFWQGSALPKTVLVLPKHTKKSRKKSIVHSHLPLVLISLGHS